MGHPAGGKIGPDEWTDVFTQAAYYVYGWVDVAKAFAAWVHDGDAAPLVDLYGGPPFDDNGLAVYLGGSCTDAKWPTNWNTWRRDNWNYFAKAPFLTWAVRCRHGCRATVPTCNVTRYPRRNRWPH